VAGVLYGRPFGYREGLLIWPWTFFLFTWSAAACGPCFTIFVTRLTEKISGKQLVKPEVIQLLAKIAGWMLASYMVVKVADTLWWAFKTAPGAGFNFMHFYSNNALYGLWILFAEIVVCGILPAVILTVKPLRERSGLLFTAVILASIGVCLNRWVMVLQVLAAPVMPFDQWALYYPSWQEVATTILPVAYGVILVLISYRYLPIFPQEQELNPVDSAA
jgi:molybdopterin-containing oxidoreductase family membrane subunit